MSVEYVRASTAAASAADIARVVLPLYFFAHKSLYAVCMCMRVCFFQLCSRFVRSHFDFNLYVLLLIFSSLVFMCLWCFCFLSYRHILFIIRSAFEMEKWSHKIFRCVCRFFAHSQYVRLYNAIVSISLRRKIDRMKERKAMQTQQQQEQREKIVTETREQRTREKVDWQLSQV